MSWTLERINELLNETDDICMECPRPPAWEGGEETCSRCMVRKLCSMLHNERRKLKKQDEED